MIGRKGLLSCFGVARRGMKNQPLACYEWPGKAARLARQRRADRGGEYGAPRGAAIVRRGLGEGRAGDDRRRRRVRSRFKESRGWLRESMESGRNQCDVACTQSRDQLVVPGAQVFGSDVRENVDSTGERGVDAFARGRMSEYWQLALVSGEGDCLCRRTGISITAFSCSLLPVTMSLPYAGRWSRDSTV